MKQQTEQERIVNKFKLLSDKYHKMSLLFYEMGQSINIEIKNKGIEHSRKKIREYLKTLNLDYDKITEITKTNIDINYIDLKGGIKE